MAPISPATLALGESRDLAVRGFRVTVVQGPAPGLVFDCNDGRCTIGSLAENTVVLDDATVSRFHCELVAAPGGVRVRDLESKNGTIVDGVRVFAADLRDGSLVRIGRCVVRVDRGGQFAGVPPSTATSFGRLVGQSVAARTAFAWLERAASSDVTVLLEGETGTGKEAAARALHAASARASGPFLVFDCGATAAGLIEDELFGHERGAFTGADVARAGVFEAAAGGTVFLDEIGELRTELQPRLLRVLESREIRRLGSTESVPVDVRIIAATHRDLRAEVNSGGFREDLYFRLAVLRVTLPSLRERPEDLEAIASALLDDLGATPAQREPLLSASALGEFAAYAWPGNVRELRNFLESCLTVGRRSPGHAATGERPMIPIDGDAPYREARQRVLDVFEVAYVAELLRRHDGNVSAAARAAGLSRVTLYALMRRHGVTPE